jgi:hypothetical protein
VRSKTTVKERKGIFRNIKEKGIKNGQDFQTLYQRVLIRDKRDDPLAR